MPQAFGEYDDRTDDFALHGDARDEEYPPRRERRLPTVALTVLVMAAFAGGLWFAYHLGARHAAVGAAGVPLIRADRTLDKVKPAQPGGMQIPDQNASIYNETPGVPPTEDLLPPPEQPLPRPEPTPQIAAAPSPQIAAAPPQQQMAAAPPPPAITLPAAATTAPPRQRTAVPPPAAAPQPAAAAAPARRPAKFGRIEIRLAAVRTPEQARSEWQRLKHANPDLLGRLSAFAVRTEGRDKGLYYRVEAGPFDDAAAAARLCGELQRRKVGCLVAR